MTFVSRQLVRFAHVDAAGIVFYPRYFEMLNAAVEDYFADEVGVDFATMHGTRRLGVPIVQLASSFVAPSRLGDVLDIGLEAASVGHSSVVFAAGIACAGELRVTADATLVCMDLDTGRAAAWPADLRPRVAAALA